MGTLISASFVIPHPPGCPILVPGQLVTKQVVQWLELLMIENVEIHEFSDGVGIKVWAFRMRLPFSMKQLGSVTMFPFISASTMAATRLLIRLFSQIEDDEHMSDESKRSVIWMELSLTYSFCVLICVCLAWKRERAQLASASRCKAYHAQMGVFGTIGILATFTFVRSTEICGPVLALVLAQAKLLLDPVFDIFATGTWLEPMQAMVLPIVVLSMLTYAHNLNDDDGSDGSASGFIKVAWGLSYPSIGSCCWAFGRAYNTGSRGLFTSATWFFFYHLLIGLVCWFITGAAHLTEHIQVLNTAIMKGLVLCFYEIALMGASMLASPVATTVAHTGMIAILYIFECIIGWELFDKVKGLAALTCVIATLVFNLAKHWRVVQCPNADKNAVKHLC